MAKILIVHASFGEGHKKAAWALKNLPESSCCDLLDFSHPLFKTIYSWGYLWITNRFRNLWGVLFSLAKNNIFSSLANKFNQLIFFSFPAYLKKVKPKVIILTHFFPSSLVVNIKNKIGSKVICVVTDLRVHPLWVNGCIDYYFAALEQTKADLIELGVDQEKIIVGFAPLRGGFFRTASLESLRKKFNLDSRSAVIFVSSLRGSFPLLKLSVEAILKNFNIIVIYGRNQKLKKYLDNINLSSVRSFAVYEDIWELFSLCSVIITKPGGLTAFEGIYLKKPFIFTHFIPGQEKANMDILIKCDVARFVQNKDELLEAIHYFEQKYKNPENIYPLELEDIGKPLAELILKLTNV